MVRILSMLSRILVHFSPRMPLKTNVVCSRCRSRTATLSQEVIKALLRPALSESINTGCSIRFKTTLDKRPARPSPVALWTINAATTFLEWAILNTINNSNITTREAKTPVNLAVLASALLGSMASQTLVRVKVARTSPDGICKTSGWQSKSRRGV